MELGLFLIYYKVKQVDEQATNGNVTLYLASIGRAGG